MNKFLQVLFAFSSLVALSAYSDETNIRMSGAYCQPSYGADPSNLTRDNDGLSWTMPKGAGGPTSAYWLPIYCPFQVSSENQDSDLVSGYTLYVTAYDRHPDINVKCWLDAVGEDGATLKSSKNNTSNSADGLKRFRVEVLGLSAVPKVPMVYCELPQAYNGNRSYLVSLRLQVHHF